MNLLIGILRMKTYEMLLSSYLHAPHRSIALMFGPGILATYGTSTDLELKYHPFLDDFYGNVITNNARCSIPCSQSNTWDRWHLSFIELSGEWVDGTRVSSHEIRVLLQMSEGIKTHIEDVPNGIDILHCIHRAALELIGQGGLGHSFDTLENDSPYTEYPKAMKELMCVVPLLPQSTILT